MTKVYLRVEAVNLDNLLGDTEDLSTIRGSGLMILDLAKPVKKAIATAGMAQKAELITCGASQVVFRVDLDQSIDADKVADDLSRRLRLDGLLKYATLVVDYHTADYDEAREALLAKNRWRQVHQSRVSIAGAFPCHREGPAEDATRRAPWCFVDNVRPAAQLGENVRNEEKLLVSESVYARREYGHQQKQAFYKDQDVAGWEPKCETIKTLKAAWHFHQLAAFDGRERPGEIPSNLNGKMALFYVDGNGFGERQSVLARSEHGQQEWDKKVQGQKKAALDKILKDIWDPNVPDQPGFGWWNRSSNGEWRFRLETLMWGGDELLWVVPAWQGWQVARAFFDAIREQQTSSTPGAPVRIPERPWAPQQERRILNLDAKPSKKELEAQRRQQELEAAKAREAEARKPLSYSAGLVFCHAAAPIHRVWKLAKELADEAKSAGKSQKEEADKNLVAYAVLESFDQLGQAVQAARIKHLPFPPSADGKQTKRQLQLPVLHADDLTDDNLLGHIRWMKEHFPRGAVYKLLRILRTEENAGQADSKFRRWLGRATAEIPDARTNSHLAAFGGVDSESKQALSPMQRIRWLHLAELWDYVV